MGAAVSRDTAPPASTKRILEGRLFVQVGRFGTPLAIGMGLQTTFNLVDAYILGRLEPGVASAALGAIGICDQLAALGTIVSYGLSVATATILSRRHGEGDSKEVHRVASQSLVVILGLGVVFFLVAMLGAGWLMRDVVGAKGRVAVLGTSYLRTMIGGSFSIFLLLHLTTIQRALGSAKTPISMLLGANALNLALAVLLVYGPGAAPPIFAWGPPVARALGIPRLELIGAAWATILARIVFTIPTFIILVNRFGLFGRGSWTRPDSATLRRIWNVGWPTSAQLVVRISAMLATHSIVARAFTTETDQSATTALGIVFRLETMALFIGLGWGSASQTFMGQNLGARSLARAKASGWYATIYNAGMMAFLACIYQAFGDRIVGFFDHTDRVVAFATEYIRWVSPSYVCLGIGIVLGSAIQGAGATLQTLLIDLWIVCLVQVPASIVVVFVAGLGPVRLWQVVAATYFAYAIAYTFVYRRGRYLHTALAT
jgi:putative MATE family efflux protein